MKPSLNPFGLLSVVCLVCVSGCSVDAISTESVSQAVDELTTSEVTLDPVPFPDNVKFLAITARGSGCPKNANSYAVDIAPDGQAFTVTFSQHETSIGVGEAVKTSNCNLKVKVQMPESLTYAVASFSYGGFVYLEKAGMRASQQSRYYFQGDPLLNERGRTTWRGPVDQDYLIPDNVATSNRVWKPCGGEQNLHIPTKLRLQNNRAMDGQGYINTLAVDGSIRLQLLFDRCH